MKTLLKSRQELEAAGRWDIDFHLPPEGIKKFPAELLRRVDEVADVVKDKRDPGKEPDTPFQYIDIAAVDVTVGTIVNPQDVDGSEAPSRARKVVRAFDVIVSTCRPTRGAIAVVPVSLHDQIASTAFSIVRAKEVNPFYLHFALRLPSTLEQFRKWSTGSSYPAILDSDVKKTLIPVPSEEVQDAIAEQVVAALQERAKAIRAANVVWGNVLSEITSSLTGKKEAAEETEAQDAMRFEAFTLAAVRRILAELPTIRTDASVNGNTAPNPRRKKHRP
jgi:type I restriction enzyme S subunit